MNPSRRDVLVTIAALATPLADAQTTTLSAPEIECLKALVDTIIPRTDTPGAADADVHLTIDGRVAANPALIERLRAGLRALDEVSPGASFASASAQQRIDLLQARVQDPFFRLAKDMTIDAYYASREGLTEELGWHGNTFLTEFKGCTHPEHQH